MVPLSPFNKFGGLFLFNCNYDVNDLSVPSLFYFQLLKWWSEFREDFALVKDWHNIIWNNRDIRIDGSPVFYKHFFLSGVVYLKDLLLNCSNNIDSFEIAARNIEKSNSEHPHPVLYHHFPLVIAARYFV